MNLGIKFHIFVIAVMAVITAYVGFQFYSLYSAKSKLMSVDDRYVYNAHGEYDLTVVKFLDYSCIYCRQSHLIISNAIEKDGAVRFIPRPVFSYNPLGSAAAFMLYAAAQQGKFSEAHDYLMNNFERFDPKKVEEQHLGEFARALNLDIDQLNKDLDSSEVQALIAENSKIFENLNGQSTPTFYIGPDLVYAPNNKAPSVADLLNIFAEARQIR